jgi:uncharacterized protein (TIGR02246 family)
MKNIPVLACIAMLAFATIAEGQTKADEDAVRGLPQAFSDAFNKHDARRLGQIMAEDVDFVTVGLVWLHGRPDFEKYHRALFVGRFKDISQKVVETHVRFIRSDVAVVRNSFMAEGDKNLDGSARPRRFGLNTMVAEKRDGVWLVVAVQNVNGPTDTNGPRARPPEAEGIQSPIVIPTK